MDNFSTLCNTHRLHTTKPWHVWLSTQHSLSFLALTGFHGCSCPHLVLCSIRGESLQWEVRRCWRLQLILNYTLHILSVCLYPYLSSMQSERFLLYCQLWPAQIYHIFPHYLIRATIFRKIILNIKCVLIFHTNLVWNICCF